MKKNKKFDIMETDFYEFTMSQAYFNEGKKDEIVYFDGFFRKIPFDHGYAVMAGGDEVIEFIRNIHFTEEDIAYLRSLNKFTEPFLEYLKNFKFTGDIDLIPDGTPVFGNEPIVTVKAPIIEAQLIETQLLAILNSNIKFATASKRLLMEAGDIPVMEFGARRSDQPTRATKCGYLAGSCGTSNTKLGRDLGIPVLGTMAHSMVTEAESEYDAFLSYAKTYPENTVLLVDTYDTLKSGIPNAIQVAKDYLIPNGYRLSGIRIDSGDLAYTAKMARRMLDEAGMEDAKICVSNGLTAEALRDLKLQGAPIDSIGAGDNMCAPKERVGVVYKLVGVVKNGEIVHKIKVSDDPAKTIQPGYKKVYRIYDQTTNKALGDVLALYNEVLKEDEFTLIDIENEYNTKTIHNYRIRNLQEKIFESGNLIYQEPTMEEKREYCKREMETLYDEHKRLLKPAKYYIDGTKELLKLKRELILASKQKGYEKRIGKK